MALIVIGIASIAYGVLDSSVTADRIWVSALINGWFFFSIALMATTFIAINSASQSGWVVVLKRVFEAVSLYVPVGAITLIIVFIAASMHWTHIYHWMDP
ncbi:MAG: quinol:cytochrome C oxidoreductase, partial [Salibacteraceae bacterium]